MIASFTPALGGGTRLIEQRRLLHHFGLAAAPAFGANIGVAGVAAAVGAEIDFGLAARTRIGAHVEDALIQPLGRDRLGQEFCDARSEARRRAALLSGPS